VDLDGLQRLCSPTRKNLNANMKFKEELSKLVPITCFSESCLDLSGLSEKQVIDLFGVALGKWLLGLSHSARPEWTVEMIRSFKYTINAQKGAVMLSLAFEMTPHFSSTVDSTGISKGDAPSVPFPTEAENAVKLARGTAYITDVDSKLEDDKSVKAALCSEAADLMESAGFDKEKFIDWVNAGEPPTAGS
jgi:hypothetical protein